MATLLTRMFTRPRVFCANCMEGQGRNCACCDKLPRKRRSLWNVTAGQFWGAYLFVVLPLVLVGLWRAFA